MDCFSSPVIYRSVNNRVNGFLVLNDTDRIVCPPARAAPDEDDCPRSAGPHMRKKGVCYIERTEVVYLHELHDIITVAKILETKAYSR